MSLNKILQSLIWIKLVSANTDNNKHTQHNTTQQAHTHKTHTTHTQHKHMFNTPHNTKQIRFIVGVPVSIRPYVGFVPVYSADGAAQPQPDLQRLLVNAPRLRKRRSTLGGRINPAPMDANVNLLSYGPWTITLAISDMYVQQQHACQSP